ARQHLKTFLDRAAEKIRETRGEAGVFEDSFCDSQIPQILSGYFTSRKRRRNHRWRVHMEKVPQVWRNSSLKVVEYCLRANGKSMDARRQQIVRRRFEGVAEACFVMDYVKGFGPIGPLLQIWVGADDPVL